MTFELRLVIGFIVLLQTITLVYKGNVRRDWGILGPIAPRVFLLGVVLFDVILGEASSVYFHVGIVLVVFSDLISGLFVLRSKRFFYEMYNAELVGLLQDLRVKYEFLVSHAPVGIYIINRMGRFEFVNKLFCDITEYTEEELLKMTVFDIAPREKHAILERQLIERIEDIVPIKSYVTEIKTKSGNLKKVQVSAKHTVNGHDTITGSVHHLEE